MKTINFTEQISPFSKTTIFKSSFKYSVLCENHKVSEFTSYKLAKKFLNLISKEYINYNYTIIKIK